MSPSRIIVFPVARTRQAIGPRFALRIRRDSQRPMVNYHRDLMDDRERAEAERDSRRGLVPRWAGGCGNGVAVTRGGARGAAGRRDRLGGQGLRAGPARHAKEGLEAFRTALTVEPNRESALTGAAYLAAKAGQPEEAVEYWRRAIAKSPWRSDYRAELAPLLLPDSRLARRPMLAKQALRLNPTNVEVRKLLVRCYLRLENHQAARDEFETLMGFDLTNRDELLRLFAPLTRPR